jgi:hypothetical protein
MVLVGGVLTISSSDILKDGDRRYRAKADAIKSPFYSSIEFEFIGEKCNIGDIVYYKEPTFGKNILKSNKTPLDKISEKYNFSGFTHTFKIIEIIEI